MSLFVIFQLCDSTSSCSFISFIIMDVLLHELQVIKFSIYKLFKKCAYFLGIEVPFKLNRLSQQMIKLPELWVSRTKKKELGGKVIDESTTVKLSFLPSVFNN